MAHSPHRLAREPTASYRPLGSEGRLTRAGRYLLGTRLGVGGMGAVYKAWDPELNRQVAVKLMRPRSGRAAAEAQIRLRREAQSMAALQHPNVLGIYDVGLTPSGVFLAMPLVDGPDVAAWLQHDHPDWRQIVRVFATAGRGLVAAHAAGIVHRDFKPTNVLLDREGGVFVADFGLASFGEGERRIEADKAKELDDETSDNEGRLTRQGTAMGTPAYMAPEQHEGKTVDARSDQFSFCVALFEALYGKVPFEGVTSTELWRAKRQGTQPPANGAPIPQRVLNVLDRGLCWHPDDRYPDMEALLFDLERCAPIGSSRSTKRWVTGIFVGTLATLALVAAVLEQAQPKTTQEHTTPSVHREALDAATLSFAQARQLARNPRSRAQGIQLAQGIQHTLIQRQPPNCETLLATIGGWLDAMQDARFIATPPTDGEGWMSSTNNAP